jgi:GNAT superfamily N-acetyltransferase
MDGSKTEVSGLRFGWLDERIGATDVEQIRGLFNASLALDDMIGFSGPIPAGEQAGFFDGLRFDLERRRKEALLVHGSDGALVAMALLSRNGQPNCRHIAEISKCIVHPLHRGRGILTAGLRCLLARCQRQGIDVLTLDVRQGSRAERLWCALGFQPFGELPDYARVKGQIHRGVYLWARLDDLMARARRASAG